MTNKDLDKYLGENIYLPSGSGLKGPVSREYKKFREEEVEKKLGIFEKLCKISNRFVHLKCPDIIKKRIEDPIFMSGLKASEDEVFSLLILSFLVSTLIIIPLSFLISFPANIILIFIPLFISYNVLIYPAFYADVIRIKAGNETVKIILYMAIYLSLSPVYDNAVQFAAANCSGPLGLDFKKIIWDVEMGKYSNIKQALGAYSKKWSIWNENFVTALTSLQTIEMQSGEEEKQETISEALNDILASTFEEMKNYSKNLRTPSMMLHSFGILLPVFGLIMFPLVSIFMTRQVNPVFIALGYTVILPAFLLWFLYRIISRRPAAFSHSQKGGGVKPKKYFTIFGKVHIPIFLTTILIGIIISIPGIIYFGDLYSDYHRIHTQFSGEDAINEWKEYCQRSYKTNEPGESILESRMLKDVFFSMFPIWGMSIFVILYTYLRSNEGKKQEDFIRKIEQDFEIGLFELGKSLSENIPIEKALPNILEKYKTMNREKSPMYVFFEKIMRNIRSLAMTFKQALFDEKYGVLKEFPSSVIHDVMHTVASSLDKGPKIAANASKNIANYLAKIRQIEEMIKDILDDVVSSLKLQTNFIAPFVTAIVASMAVLIVQLLQNISVALGRIEQMFNIGWSSGGGLTNALDMIHLEEVVPPTVLQLIVGIYLVEIVIIISVFLTGINKGFDEVSRDMVISKNLLMAIILYTVVLFIMVIFFNPIIQQVGHIGG